MRRVLVIGCGGAGKTTLARRLAEQTNLPLVHLDTLYWRPGWQPTPVDEWEETIARLVARDAWVMDGNYGGTLDIRIQACDTVVFVDAPRLICLWRIFRRWVRHAGHTRPDLAPGCPEQISWEFVRWIWTYPKRRRPSILEKLHGLSRAQRLVWIRNAAEAKDFLAACMPPSVEQ